MFTAARIKIKALSTTMLSRVSLKKTLCKIPGTVYREHYDAFVRLHFKLTLLLKDPLHSKKKFSYV